MKKFKSFIFYLLTYVLITFTTAFGVVLISDPTGANSIKIGETTAATTTPPQLNYIINNLSTVHAINANIQANVTTLTDEFNIDLSVEADFNEGLKKPAIKGVIDVKINSNPININFVYKNEAIYINLFNKDFKIETNNFIGSIKQILTLINVELPEINLGIDLDNFSLDSVLGMLTELTENKQATQTIINISLPVVGNLTLVCDLNYAIKQISLPKTTLGDISFDVNANISYPEKVEVNTPDKNCLEVTNLFNIAEAVINTINQDYIGFDVDLKIENAVLSGKLSASLKNYSLQFETKILNNNLSVVLLDNTVYFSLGNINLKFALADINQINDILVNQFNIDIPLDKIIGLLASVKNGDIQNQLKNFDIKNFDFSSIDLSFISLSETNNNEYTISLENFGDIILTIKNSKIESLSFDNSSINVKLTASKYNKITLSDAEFTDVNDFIPTINSILNTTKQSNFTGNINIKYNNQNYNISYVIQNNNGLYLYLKTTILNKELEINIVNNVCFINFSNTKLVVNFDDLPSLINSILEKFNLSIPKTDSQKIIETIENLINKNINPNFISNLTKIKDGISLELLNKVNIKVIGENTINNINIKYDNLQVDININASCNNISVPEINIEEYTKVNDLVDVMFNVYDYILNKQFYFDVNVVYDKLQLFGKIYYNNGLSFDINTSIYGKEVTLKLINKVVYVNIDGLKIKFALSQTEQLLNFINEKFNIDIAYEINKLLNNIDYNKILNNINNFDIELTLNKINLALNNLAATINLENKNIKNIILTSDKLNANINVLNCQEDITVTGDYYNLDDAIPMVESLINTISNKQLSITGTIKFNAFNNIQTLSINNLSVDFNKTLTVYANLELNGATLELAIINNIIYANAYGLKVRFALNEINDFINWINSTFNTNIDLTKPNNFDLEEFIKNLDFNTIKSITNTPNGIMVSFYSENGNDNILLIDYNQTLNKIICNYNDFSFEINVFDNANINQININEYSNLSELTIFADAILNYVKAKQYNISGLATVFEGNNVTYNADVNLQANLKNTFELSGNAKLTGKQDFAFDINYYNNYLFVNYNNLKVKICENDLKELIVIALQMLGINPDILPFLSDVASGMDVNLNNIAGLLPNGNSSNPLAMLNIIKNISFNSNELIVTINSAVAFNSANANDMQVVVKTNGEALTNLKITNLYTNVDTYEHFDLDINFNNFEKVNKPQNTNDYIDLSGANELIKAIINTAELNYFEIDGSLKINGKLIGININWDVPLNIKVKLDENRKPEIMAVIGEIPTMLGVNNDVPYQSGDTESGHDRMLYVYYKDGYVYFYRSEYINRFASSARKYEKKLLISLEELINNPLEYVQYAFGFTDDIMSAIRSSLELSKGHTPNLGNIINSFEANNKTDFSIELNMQEISNDPKMGTMAIGLSVINNAETNNKNYIGSASFNMFMPLASVFELTLSSNNLKLINIGKQLDFTNLYNYINSYSYKENAKWEANNNNWNLASEKTYTINFVTNCDIAIENLTAPVNASITLPKFNNRVDITNSVRYTYKFLGWYLTENFKPETEFTSSIMPRGDTTLYAKWELLKIENVVTLTFETFGGTSFNPISDIAGNSVDVSNNVPHKCDNKVKGSYKVGKGYLCTHTRYKFEGWFTDANFTNRFNGYMPSNNLTLYAKYSTTTFEHYWGAFGTSCKENCH